MCYHWPQCIHNFDGVLQQFMVTVFSCDDIANADKLTDASLYVLHARKLSIVQISSHESLIKHDFGFNGEHQLVY